MVTYRTKDSDERKRKREEKQEKYVVEHIKRNPNAAVKRFGLSGLKSTIPKKKGK